MRRVFSRTPLTPGASVALDPEEAHHVSRVLRLRAGDDVAVFDGSGGEWDAKIEAVEKTMVRIRVGAPLLGSPEPPIDVAVYQALVRPERLEWVFQKGTEVGVSSFGLFTAERSEAPAPSPSRMERYERIVLESAKQSGRRTIPTIALGELPQSAEIGRRFLLDTSSGAEPFAIALSRDRATRVGIAIGPEGGFTADELARPWERVSLGPRILRTETAGVVAAAIVLHAWGDLGR